MAWLGIATLGICAVVLITLLEKAPLLSDDKYRQLCDRERRLATEEEVLRERLIEIDRERCEIDGEFERMEEAG
jgi:hypothetical protein